MRLVSIHKLYPFLLFAVLGVTAAQAQVWTLQQCLDTAQVYNKNLRITQNNIFMGKQKQEEIKADLWPKATINTDYTYFTDLPYQLVPESAFGGPEEQFKELELGVSHSINARIQIAMPLYSPEIYGAIEASKITSKINELRQIKTKEQIFFEVSSLYYNAQILHHKLSFIRHNLTKNRELLESNQLPHEQLVVNETAINKVKLQIAQLITMHKNVSSNYQQVINSLKFTMGIGIMENVQIDPAIQYHSFSEYHIQSATDLRLTEVNYRLLLSELHTLNKSRFLPSLNLLGTYGTTGFGYDKKPNDFLNFYPLSYVGIQMSFPLFNGTKTLHKINQKKFQIRNSALQYELLADQNDIQIENARIQHIEAFQSIKTIEDQIELAEAIYGQTLLQQKKGAASLNDVLSAENAMSTTQQLYVSAIVNYLKADLELKKLTGNILKSKPGAD